MTVIVSKMDPTAYGSMTWCPHRGDECNCHTHTHTISCWDCEVPVLTAFPQANLNPHLCCKLQCTESHKSEMSNYIPLLKNLFWLSLGETGVRQFLQVTTYSSGICICLTSKRSPNTNPFEVVSGIKICQTEHVMMYAVVTPCVNVCLYVWAARSILIK